MNLHSNKSIHIRMPLIKNNSIRSRSNSPYSFLAPLILDLGSHTQDGISQLLLRLSHQLGVILSRSKTNCCAERVVKDQS